MAAEPADACLSTTLPFGDIAGRDADPLPPKRGRKLSRAGASLSLRWPFSLRLASPRLCLQAGPSERLDSATNRQLEALA